MPKVSEEVLGDRRGPSQYSPGARCSNEQLSRKGKTLGPEALRLNTTVTRSANFLTKLAKGEGQKVALQSTAVHLLSIWRTDMQSYGSTGLLRSLSAQLGEGYARAAVPVTSFQAATVYYGVVDDQLAQNRWRRGRKCEAIMLCTSTKRWACRADLNRCIRLSRSRVG